jgi:hypothetical protein
VGYNKGFKPTQHPTKNPDNYERGSSLVFSGDFAKCALWLGYAYSNLRVMVMSSPGTQTKVLQPTKDVTVRIDTRPNRIFITAKGGGFLVVWYAIPDLNARLGFLTYPDVVARPSVENPVPVFYWRGPDNEHVLDLTNAAAGKTARDAGFATANFTDGSKQITVYLTAFPFETNSGSITQRVICAYIWNNTTDPAKKVFTDVRAADYEFIETPAHPLYRYGFIDGTEAVKGMWLSPDCRYAAYFVARQDTVSPPPNNLFDPTSFARFYCFSLEFFYDFNLTMDTLPQVPQPTETQLFALGANIIAYNYSRTASQGNLSIVSTGNPYYQDVSVGASGTLYGARWSGNTYYYAYLSEEMERTVSANVTSSTETYSEATTSNGQIWLGKYDFDTQTHDHKAIKIAEIPASLAIAYGKTANSVSDSYTQDYCFVGLVVCEPKYGVYLYSVLRYSVVLDGWSDYRVGGSPPNFGTTKDLPYKIIESFEVIGLVNGTRTTLKHSTSPQATKIQSTYVQQQGGAGFGYSQPRIANITDPYGRVYAISTSVHTPILYEFSGSTTENLTGTIGGLFAADQEYSDDYSIYRNPLDSQHPYIRPTRAYGENGRLIYGNFLDRVAKTVDTFAIDLDAVEPVFTLSESYGFGTVDGDTAVTAYSYAAKK